MWTSQNCLHVNIHTSVVIFVKNNANAMVKHVTLCSNLVETETKDRTVTEEQMKLFNSKLDYLKRALNQQFLQSANKSNAPMFTPAKLFCGFGDNQVKQIM